MPGEVDGDVPGESEFGGVLGTSPPGVESRVLEDEGVLGRELRPSLEAVLLDGELSRGEGAAERDSSPVIPSVFGLSLVAGVSAWFNISCRPEKETGSPSAVG